MGRITTTSGAVFIPEMWADEVKAAYESRLVLGQFVKKFNHTGKSGDIIHVPDVSNLVANDMNQTGTVTPQAVTESETQITINKWKEASIQLSDLARIQSRYDLRSEYTGKMGYAIALKVEQDLMALGVDATIQAYDADGTAISASGGTIDLAGIAKAKRYLLEQNVPEQDLLLVINPKAWESLIKINAFTSIDYAGSKPLVSGKIGMVMGMDVVVSNNLPNDGNSLNNCLMLQKEAFVLAQQLTPRTQAQYEQRNLAWLVTVDTVYGVKLFRTTNVVRLALAA